MKTIALFLLLCFVILSTGCPKTIPNKKVIETIIKTFETEFKKDQIRYGCYVRGYDHTEPLSETAPCKETSPTDKPKYADDAKRIRDDVTGRFVRVIDSNYEQFANDLQNRRSTTNFLGDITELGVGAAIGITNGERALQILGVALTAFRGGRKSVDQSFYERQSTPILITKMDTSRDRVMAAILIKREKFEIDKYSLEDALGDVIKYFWAGTLTRAFVELAKDTSVQAKEAEKNLEIIEDVQISAIPSIQSQRVSDGIATQRASLSSQFTTAEAITVALTRDAEIRKVIAKFEAAWTEIEAQDEYKPTIAALKLDAEYNTTIGKINDAANVPTKREVNRLFAKFLSLISTADETAGNTKLRDTFLAILKKVNQ